MGTEGKLGSILEEKVSILNGVQGNRKGWKRYHCALQKQI